jgi:choline-sulfatase
LKPPLKRKATTLQEDPNILYIMTDQQRFDTICALGNEDIYTPNFDRLVQRGLAFTNAYSTCPVCVAARYTIRTGCEPTATRVFSNGIADPAPGQADSIPGRCGPYLTRGTKISDTRPICVARNSTVARSGGGEMPMPRLSPENIPNTIL